MKHNLESIIAPIFGQIEEMVKDIPGWSPIYQLYTLFNLIYFSSHLNGDIIEIGSWCGRSTSVLGMAAEMIGNTNIICIDLFPEKNDWIQNQDGSYSFKVAIKNKVYSGYQDQTVWKEPFERDIAPLYEKYDRVFDIFMETITKNNLLNTVKPYKGTSEILNKVIDKDFRCKLAFIDGDHSYDAVCQDIKNIEPFLIEGGWICFDDAFSHYDSVNHAIEDCIINNVSYDLCQQMTRKLFIAQKRVLSKDNLHGLSFDRHINKNKRYE
jgi:predicted O-methyltransferase YrrM